MNELLKELEDIKNYPSDILPHYGYGDKKELIEIVQKEIDEAYEKEKQKLDSYSDDDNDLEKERTYLCISQGISRYC